VTIKSLVIGLGKIGYKYDLKKSGFLSHVKSLDKNKNFSLVGAVEKNSYLRRSFRKKMNLPAFLNIKESLKKLNPDLIVIATPLETHFKVTQEICKNNYRDKILIIEKPVGKNFLETRKIFRLAKKNNVKIYVNYIRQYQNDLIKIFKKIKSKKFDEVNINYNRGLRNNASHLICLLLNIYGKIKKFKILRKHRFSPSFKIYFKNLVVNFKFKNNLKNIGDIVFKNKNEQIKILKNFKNIYFIKNNKVSKMQKTNMNNYQINVYQAIFKNVKKKKKILITQDSVFNTSKIVDNILNYEK